MVSYILITAGYSILLFMNPLNFKFAVFKNKNVWKIKKNVKNVKKRDQKN